MTTGSQTVLEKSQLHQVLRFLCANQPCTNDNLAKGLCLSAAVVRNALAELEQLGVPLQREHSLVRLRRNIELLDPDLILGQAGLTTERLAGLDVHLEIGSTNDFLLQQAALDATMPRVCLAEVQSKGRGRRGRTWVSPFGANLYFSLLYRWPPGMALSGLSIALGVAVAELLADFGSDDVGIKWPNDLYWRGRKLGGLLVDISGDARRGCDIVAGLGLNIDMGQSTQRERIDQPWTDLAQVLGRVPSRNALAAGLIERWLRALMQYRREGLGGFLERYARFDICAGERVSVLAANDTVEGVARGINPDGALLVDVGGKIEAFFAAEVSLRLQSNAYNSTP